MRLVPGRGEARGEVLDDAELSVVPGRREVVVDSALSEVGVKSLPLIVSTVRLTSSSNKWGVVLSKNYEKNGSFGTVLGLSSQMGPVLKSGPSFCN